MPPAPRVDRGAAVLAALIAAIALAALWESRRFTPFASIFPVAVGSALLICSGLVLWRVLRGRTRVSPSIGREGLLRSGALVVVMLLWVALLETVGFAPASGVGFFVLALIANREPLGAKRLAGFALAAVACVLALQLLFQNGLGVRLPAATWWSAAVG
jgi:hypothetical protein